jgi:hypothetical protein
MHARLLAISLLVGCPSAAPVASDQKIVETKTVETKREAKVVDEGPMGRVGDGPLPIAGLLGKAPADVEPQLAEPTGKGMARQSCVRFVPERVWFRCQFALQRYGDKSGAYKAIGVEYEDGKATALAFEGLTGAQGDVDPKTALAYVGLELPGEPKLENPDAETRVWSWFNAAARLRIDGRQYRVIVSSIGGDWARTKVEIKLNDPLTEEERSRVVDERAPG